MAKKTDVIRMLWLLLLVASEAMAYNVLFVSIFSARSHKNTLDPIAEELASRGHNVTFVSSIKETKEFDGIQEVFLQEASDVIRNLNYSFFDGKMDDPKFIINLHQLVNDLADVTYQFPFVQELIRTPRDTKTSAPKYDVFVVDAIYNELILPLAHHVGVPTVYSSPSILLPNVAWSLNIPTPYSYVPSFPLFMPGEMGFLQRIQSVFTNLMFIYTRFYVSYPSEEGVIRKYLPEAPLLRDLEKNVSFLLTNDHCSITPRVPNMPYFVEVGGLHLKPAKQLPEDLQNFLDSSGDDGVIYFSLGSATSGHFMPNILRQNLIKAFAQLKQKILWKNEEQLKEISDNVKMISWVPQNDLLAHPNLKLFITHGGGLSIQEAGYHGCPLLGLPLSADQQSNMANVINAGFGEAIEWRTLTVEGFLEKIRKILGDTKYKANAARVSTLLRDRPEHPKKTAAYWIEYVIRHNGARHLKSGADNLNFFQYFLLDAMGIILIGLIGTLSAIAFALKKLIRIFTVKQYNGQKSKEN